MLKSSGVTAAIAGVFMLSVALFIIKAPVTVNWQANGGTAIQQPGVNYVDSDTGVAWAVTNDANNDRVTITGSYASSSYPTLLTALMSQTAWAPVLPVDFSVSAVAGTGTAGTSWRNASVSTGATPGSTALLRTSGGQGKGLSADVTAGLVNWSKPITLAVVFSIDDTAAAGIGYISFGRSGASAVGTLATKAIAVRTAALALTGAVYDGSAETIVDLNTTLTLDVPYTIMVQSDGTGTVTWYMVTYPSGVYTLTELGSTGMGPTGLSAVNTNLPQIDTQNGATAADYEIDLHSYQLFVQQ